ncbi:hypothetical protein ACHAWF_018184, partial [Thalassiosira exigua]
ASSSSKPWSPTSAPPIPSRPADRTASASTPQTAPASVPPDASSPNPPATPASQRRDPPPPSPQRRIELASRKRRRLAVEEISHAILVPPEDGRRQLPQPVPDRLPPLPERRGDHAPQVRGIHAPQPSTQPRRPEELQPHEGRVHFRPGVEHRGRDLEVDVAVGVQLEHRAQDPVVLRASGGHDALRHLPLHGHRGAPHGVRVARVRQREEYLGGEVIRQVPDHREGTAGLFRQRGIRRLQDVFVPHAQLGVLVGEELHGALVDLDALEVGEAEVGEEDFGERARARSELHRPEIRGWVRCRRLAFLTTLTPLVLRRGERPPPLPSRPGWKWRRPRTPGRSWTPCSRPSGNSDPGSAWAGTSPRGGRGWRGRRGRRRTTPATRPRTLWRRPPRRTGRPLPTSTPRRTPGSIPGLRSVASIRERASTRSRTGSTGGRRGAGIGSLGPDAARWAGRRRRRAGGGGRRRARGSGPCDGGGGASDRRRDLGRSRSWCPMLFRTKQNAMAGHMAISQW